MIFTFTLPYIVFPSTDSISVSDTWNWSSITSRREGAIDSDGGGWLAIEEDLITPDAPPPFSPVGLLVTTISL